jgi:hypothetical protein
MALRDPAAGGSKSEIKTAAKHVVIFDRRPSDGGSIPPASTNNLSSGNQISPLKYLQYTDCSVFAGAIYWANYDPPRRRRTYNAQCVC